MKDEETVNDSMGVEDEPDGLVRVTVPTTTTTDGDDNDNDIDIVNEYRPRLSMGLRVLFMLNGATLAFPIMALQYVVNTKVKMPVQYLSVYGAIAFLPFSLKPAFAFASEFFPDRSSLLAALLIISGITIAATAYIPSGGVLWCIGLAFLRGLFGAWPEFLLGLSLLDEAQQQPHRNGRVESAASVFQADAATSRNVGALVADIVLFTLFAIDQYRYSESRGEILNDALSRGLLFSTALLNVFGGLFAKAFNVGSSRGYVRLNTEAMYEGGDEPDEEVEEGEDEKGHDDDDIAAQNEREQDEERLQQEQESNRTFHPTTTTNHWNVALVASLQTAVVLFALRQQIVQWTGIWLWVAFFASSVTVLVVSLRVDAQSQTTYPKRVGLYLVLKHAMPTPSYIMGTVVYEAFRMAPIMLQLHSLVGGATTTLASSAYARYLAQYCRGRAFWMVVTGTTALFSLCVLFNIGIVALSRGEESNLGPIVVFVGIGILSAITTFASELSFLPGVVLATTSAWMAGDESSPVPSSHSDTDAAAAATSNNTVGYDVDSLGGTDQGNTTTRINDTDQDDSNDAYSSRMRYGTLVSCIDFGGQIGSWLTVPLVASLGIERENHFARVDRFVMLTSLMALLPLLMIPWLEEGARGWRDQSQRPRQR